MEATSPRWQAVTDSAFPWERHALAFEIKSRPGIVEGDQGTWTSRGDRRPETVDNPLLLANRKAKKLTLRRRQPALRKRRQPRSWKSTSSCRTRT